MAATTYASAAGERRSWSALEYQWQAPATCHRPIYFEDPNLEQHGYAPAGLRWAQPAISGARFVATVPALPYLMSLHPPGECIYTLGEYRPGSNVPYQCEWIPIAAVPATLEGAAIAGLILAIP